MMAMDQMSLRSAVEEHAEQSLIFLERLVQQPSVLGAERGAQLVLADELERLGFTVGWEPISEEIADDPFAGVPSQSYEGRAVLVATRGECAAAPNRSLLVNGHLDVVPPGNLSAWETPPFQAVRGTDGWLRGRGAADMKSGFAALLLALGALGGRSQDWPLTVVGVIEEECTGNGTLASLRAGINADAVLLPEPTGLAVDVSGTGVLWFDVTTAGFATHAETSSEGVNAMGPLTGIMDALSAFSAELTRRSNNSDCYDVNFGVVRAGDWRSSVPDVATLGVRIGFPRGWTWQRAEHSVREVVSDAAERDPWLREHPPELTLTGFRAEGYCCDRDADVVRVLSGAHRLVFGELPALAGVNATTDARQYLSVARTPAVCYGARGRNVHGANEAVEIQSVLDVAHVMANFLTGWFDSGR